MKKVFYLISLFLLSSFAVNAKGLTPQELLATIEGQYKLEEGAICVQKVIQMDSLSKDKIYNIVQEFITRTYRDANSVIQVEDKESGRIIAKGLYTFYVNERFAGSAVKNYTYHIFKAEIKEGRVRITITANNVEQHCPPSQYSSARTIDVPIATCYPADPTNDYNKYYSGYLFYYSAKSIIDLLNDAEAFLEKAKLEDVVTSEDDW